MAERKLDLLDSDSGDGMEVPESVEPVNANDDTEEPPKTLTQRMAAIRAECAGVGKEEIEMQNKERTKKWTIHAHTIEGVLHGVRTLFDKHGVWLEPNLIEARYTGNRCDATFAFTFENLDDGSDKKEINWAGSGTDNADKGFAKAGTNALKEMLKKVFLITDREDAKEQTDSVEYQSNEGATRAEVDKVTDQKRAALEQWAKALKMALTKSDNLKDVQRLERENKEQLVDPELPDVTRDFFIDLIQQRKDELKGAAE